MLCYEYGENGYSDLDVNCVSIEMQSLQTVRTIPRANYGVRYFVICDV